MSYTQHLFLLNGWKYFRFLRCCSLGLFIYVHLLRTCSHGAWKLWSSGSVCYLMVHFNSLGFIFQPQGRRLLALLTDSRAESLTWAIASGDHICDSWLVFTVLWMTVIDRLVSVCVDIECESCWNTASGNKRDPTSCSEGCCGMASGSWGRDYFHPFIHF